MDAVLRIVIVYALFASLWILVSDKALEWLFKDPAQITLVSMIKGWLFVAVTSLMLYGLIWRLVNQVLTVSRIASQAQTEKNRAKQLLDNIVDSSPDAIFAKDLKGRYLLFNRETSRVVGKSTEQALGFDDTVLFPAQAEMLRANDRRVIAEDRINTYEETVTTVDGERTYLAIKGPLRDGDGKVIGLFGISRDITERKRTEQALRAAEEQFRGLVEQSIAGIYIIQDGKFAYVNPRFATIRGYGSVDELIGQDPLPLIAEKDRSTVAEYNRSLLAGEKRDIDYSFSALRKDGSCIEVGVHSTRASYHGQPAIIGLLQDISEKKRAEEAIQHYIAQLKTAFMSTVEVATVLSELRDPYTSGHERRVGEIAVAIGTELGLDESRLEGLRVAGYLHDIGKIIIPSEILSKPGKLGTVEYQLIQGHAQASYDVLKSVEWPWPVAEVALQHHERMDGSGYPQGLKGDNILLEARILAVADVVEAMSSHRPYRAGLGIDKALAEIERGRGTSYDPAAADACLRLFRERSYLIPE